MIKLIIFWAVVLVWLGSWGKLLGFFADRSTRFNNLVIYGLSYTKYSYDELKALLLSFIYYGFGLGGALGLSWFYQVNLIALFQIDASGIGLTLLGIMAELNLTAFLTSLYKGLSNPKLDFQQIMRNVYWIDGIMKLPGLFRSLAPALAGLVEEFVFRGVILLILVEGFHLPAWEAIMAVTILFMIQQVLQVQNVHQLVIIGCGCLAISVVGSGLVLASGSIIPAALAHAMFVMFYFRY